MVDFLKVLFYACLNGIFWNITLGNFSNLEQYQIATVSVISWVILYTAFLIHRGIKKSKETLKKSLEKEEKNKREMEKSHILAEEKRRKRNEELTSRIKEKEKDNEIFANNTMININIETED